MHEDRQKRAKGPENVLGKAKNWIFQLSGLHKPFKIVWKLQNCPETKEIEGKSQKWGWKSTKKKQIDSHGKPLNALRGQNRSQNCPEASELLEFELKTMRKGSTNPSKSSGNCISPSKLFRNRLETSNDRNSKENSIKCNCGSLQTHLKTKNGIKNGMRSLNCGLEAVEVAKTSV